MGQIQISLIDRSSIVIDSEVKAAVKALQKYRLL